MEAGKTVSEIANTEIQNAEVSEMIVRIKELE
jgi:hypothetical protein